MRLAIGRLFRFWDASQPLPRLFYVQRLAFHRYAVRLRLLAGMENLEMTITPEQVAVLNGYKDNKR